MQVARDGVAGMKRPRIRLPAFRQRHVLRRQPVVAGAAGGTRAHVENQRIGPDPDRPGGIHHAGERIAAEYAAEKSVAAKRITAVAIILYLGIQHRAVEVELAAALWKQQVFALDDLIAAAVARGAGLRVLAQLLHQDIVAGLQLEAGLIKRLVGIEPHRQGIGGLDIGLLLAERRGEEDVRRAAGGGRIRRGGGRVSADGQGEGRARLAVPLQGWDLQGAAMLRHQGQADFGLRRHRAVDDPDAGTGAAAEHVEIPPERAEVGLLAGLAIVFEYELHRVARRDLGRVQSGTDRSSGAQAQAPQRDGNEKAAWGFHGCVPCCRIRCSIMNLRRSRPPGSSGMRRSHCSSASWRSLGGLPAACGAGPAC